eukprot:CAMPEP_0174364102 /NCGR_PEP_ID=MMETSP0811_2-20130205/71559_1 /TAXON_ID=73025 ORGANISM="Eutreptiella gymnastica-like, Strain CCMP1594" /NCGR_SAMPLE_ID=MMETSP0811_2 /ASSEMBLY_ACC=CAM_ASM_000667 /LENGTH=70 /DNA_ID=CAMNT_0015503441 /DNA_START=327 /DNA_END=539 /DNA_ORIENTATION=-
MCPNCSLSYFIDFALLDIVAAQENQQSVLACKLIWKKKPEAEIEPGLQVSTNFKPVCRPTQLTENLKHEC